MIPWVKKVHLSSIMSSISFIFVHLKTHANTHKQLNPWVSWSLDIPWMSSASLSFMMSNYSLSTVGSAVGAGFGWRLGQSSEGLYERKRVPPGPALWKPAGRWETATLSSHLFLQPVGACSINQLCPQRQLQSDEQLWVQLRNHSEDWGLRRIQMNKSMKELWIFMSDYWNGLCAHIKYCNCTHFTK